MIFIFLSVGNNNINNDIDNVVDYDIKNNINNDINNDVDYDINSYNKLFSYSIISIIYSL